ncbi:hypothetical protein [Micromonospora humida]|uniref:Aminotransferase class I/classII domain-containing protein n=1 Tax=Micromonospora humida TaxID=2809018 RepID=A0ABS2IMH1_9ACTN|nr:hypothetical protein [Micromonospora humida]MBM7075542.1 hypothetical protein [Micromonospora humida]
MARQLGPEALETHDWFYTAGSGAVIDRLLTEVPTGERGTVLPAYQRVAAALADTTTSITIEPSNWSNATFEAPRLNARVFVVNPLHANPLAATLSTAYMAAIAGYAADTRTLLVEDDPFRGLDATDGLRPSLLSFYPEGTVYLGSWTKVLGWPAKLGFAGWPRTLRPFTRPWPVPAGRGRPHGPVGLASLLRSGHDGNIRARRHALLTRRRAELIALLRELGLSFVPPTGGAHLAVLSSDTEGLRRRLVHAGIGGLAADDFYPRRVLGPVQPFVRLAFSDVLASEWPGLLAQLRNVLSVVDR